MQFLLVSVLLHASGPLDLADGHGLAAGEYSLPRLVGKLGSRSFAAREAASESLIEFGPEAIPLLRDVATGRSEAAIRATQIIETIQSQYLFRLAKAAGGGDVGAAQRLPMWNRFHVPALPDRMRAKALAKLIEAIARADVSHGLDLVPFPLDLAAQRATLTELYERLVQIDGSSVFATTATAEHVERAPTRAPDQAATALAAILIGGHPSTQLSIHEGRRLTLLLSRADVKTLMRDDDMAHLVNWLVSGFVANLPDDGKIWAFSSVVDAGLDCRVDIARTVLKLSVTPADLAIAAQIIAGSGDRFDVELLEPHMRKRQAINQYQLARGSVRLGHFALASALFLTNQDPTDYGFQSITCRNGVGFRGDELRFKTRSVSATVACYKRWEEWRRVNFREQLATPEWAINGKRL